MKQKLITSRALNGGYQIEESSHPVDMDKVISLLTDLRNEIDLAIAECKKVEPSESALCDHAIENPDSLLDAIKGCILPMCICVD